MASTRSKTGQLGEQIAAQYLVQRGYSLIARNWRCAHGEIDIVARSDSSIVFVEVRTRHADSVDAAFESITPHKRRRMIASAHAYVDATNTPDCDWRIDVIAVALRANEKPVIEHLEDALDW